MPKIQERLIVGDRNNIDVEKLLQIVEDSYAQLARSINQKPTVYVQAEADGRTAESSVSIGDINVNVKTNSVQMCTEHTDPNTVVWTTIS